MSYNGRTRPVVLQILPRLVTGGVERGTIDIAIALQAIGGVPLVASYGGPMLKELQQEGIEHIVLPAHSKNPLVMYRNIRRLIQLIIKRKINVVHARSRAPAWSAFIATVRTGIPFLTTFHGTYTLGPLALKKPYNVVMTYGDLVITVSEFIATHIHEVYGTASERIRVIPRGVNMHKFNPTLIHPNRLIALNKAWCLSQNHALIMLPGRFTRWKGHGVLIEAIARLGRRDLQCLLVGSNQEQAHYRKYRKEVEKLIQHNGLNDTIHVVDHCFDMPAAYMLANVVVSASTRPEAFGRVAVEAQAMGRAVIATNHGGSRETIVDGCTGRLVPPGDPGALSQAILEFLTLKEEERSALSARQISHVQTHFNHETMCARTLVVYQELLESRS